MANGRLAGLRPTANTDAELFAGPTGKVHSALLNICNCDSTDANVRVALTSGAAPAAGDWLVWDAPVGAAAAPAQVGGLVVSAGQKLHVRSSNALTDFVLMGME